MRHFITPRLLKRCVIGMTLCVAANAFADNCGEPPFDVSLLSHHARGNEIWSIHAQAMPTEKGQCPQHRYRLKKTENIPENRYARITPVLLDSLRKEIDYLADEDGEYIRDKIGEPVMTLPQEHRLGFVAWRDGVNVLLDSRGKRVIPDEFDALVFEPSSDEANKPLMDDGTVIARITRKDDGLEKYTYLHFQGGRLVRRAPRWYDGEADGGSWGAAYRMVMLRKENGWLFAPLNIRNLREVLPFSDKSMGHIALNDYEHEFFYTLFYTLEVTETPLPPGIKIQNGPYETMLRHQVYDSTGAPLSLPEFHEYRKQHARETGDLLALYNYESMTCRLYAARPEDGLFPVIDQPLPLDYGHNCPNFDGGRLFARHADKTRIFVVQKTKSGAEPEFTVREEGEAPGAFFAKSRGNLLVLKTRRDDKNRYRVFDLERGQLDEEWFEDAHNCGDGFVLLKREGVWYLPVNGRLSKSIYYPAGC
ncbi:MAG: hypothetical protein LBF51_10090 [Zoogloeaceae bacterium]|jgi:hypothetical protein|nr:hypothetical protein [Zoogloeaceae bacterium]